MTADPENDRSRKKNSSHLRNYLETDDVIYPFNEEQTSRPYS